MHSPQQSMPHVCTGMKISGEQGTACISSMLIVCHCRAAPIFLQMVMLASCSKSLPTSTRDRHDIGSKGAVFHFPYALFIGPDLDPLLFFISGCKALLAFGRSQWVEDSHIEVGPFITTTPEAICSNVQPGSILCIAPVRVSPVIGCRVDSMQSLTLVVVRPRPACATSVHPT